MGKRLTIEQECLASLCAAYANRLAYPSVMTRRYINKPEVWLGAYVAMAMALGLLCVFNQQGANHV